MGLAYCERVVGAFTRMREERDELAILTWSVGRPAPETGGQQPLEL